jgi:hypothetical protein
MTLVEIKSRVGSDGVLTVSVPLGPSEANREVKVTVEPTEISPSSLTAMQDNWHEFVKNMAGCISDPTFRRHEQGELEVRNEVFP